MRRCSDCVHVQSALQIGVIYGNPEVTSGGNALKFYASVRLEVRRKATQESAKGDSIGIRVKAKVCLVLAVKIIQTSFAASCSSTLIGFLHPSTITL